MVGPDVNVALLEQAASTSGVPAVARATPYTSLAFAGDGRCVQEAFAGTAGEW